MKTKPGSVTIANPIDPTEFTPHFVWRDGTLYCEKVPLESIAERQGTPAYVYSRAAIEDSYRQYQRAFRGLPATISYSVKANSNLSILRLLSRLGSGFDIVSGGELYRIQRAGIPANRVVFSGVGKSREEIREALRARIFLFNVESEAELEILLSEAGRLLRRAPAAIRVNPHVEAGGHRHISTGKHEHKFGLGWEDARRVYLAHRDSRWLEWKGISAHIGSQILDLAPIRRAVSRLAGFACELIRNGVPVSHLDIGGGVGIRYTHEKPVTIADYARAVKRSLGSLRCHLLLEPGRSIVGASGVLLMRVLYTKTNRGKTFVILDAAMNDFIRPTLYSATHPITRVSRSREAAGGDGSGGEIIRADFVGPVCETGDCFLRNWPIEPVHSGDVLALWGAGAYGFVQSSNYNSRSRVAEVLVDGRKFRTIRKRESRSDLVRGE
jgi:diaminopimelate decarboxylase